MRWSHLKRTITEGAAIGCEVAALFLYEAAIKLYALSHHHFDAQRIEAMLNLGGQIVMAKHQFDEAVERLESAPPQLTTLRRGLS